MTNRRIARTLTAVLAAAALSLGTVIAPVAAQTSQTQNNQSPGMQQPGAAQVSEEELKSFAAAAVEIQRISDRFQAELRSTQDNAESQQLRQEVQGKMVGAVKEQGLSLEEYNEIYTLTQSDPQLQQTVLAYMQDVQ